MTIDFHAEVDKRKEALMEDLFGLLRINSERDDSKADEKHPFGPTSESSRTFSCFS